ncbi:MAG: death-on-curing protein, partial [Anaerovoracaceae bacterium]
EELLTNIQHIEDPRERAIEYFCKATREQLFWDGNKRTSTLIANKILIENGQGILFIGKGRAIEFNKTLNHYYNTTEAKPLKDCLKSCIATIKRTPFQV